MNIIPAIFEIVFIVFNSMVLSPMTMIKGSLLQFPNTSTIYSNKSIIILVFKLLTGLQGHHRFT